MLPEIIKDEEFEGEFDPNNHGGQQRDTQNTDNTEGENSNTSDDTLEGEEGLGHLKMASCEQGRFKKIDVRKGISVEKNVRFDEQHRPMKEFNVLQHSQSNFEGLKDQVIDVRRNNHIKRDRFGQMAIKSFQNAGGSIREDETLLGATPDDGGFGLDSDDRKTDLDNLVKNDPKWQTNEKLTRWIIVEAATKKVLPQPI